LFSYERMNEQMNDWISSIMI